MVDFVILAPIFEDNNEYTWKYACNKVFEVYNDFDTTIGTYINDMFTKNHIDADIRNGKATGAYFISHYKEKTGYILLSFKNNLSDIYTLVHECGHSIHAYLRSRSQKYSNFGVGSSLAECASMFGEMLLTKRLLSECTSDKERQIIITKVLDEFGMAAFQVSSRFFFEQQLYNAIKQEVSLDGDTISEYWVKSRDKIYGDSVEWLDVMKWEWTMKEHYYFPNRRFYNFPYVFAQLFVFALYKTYEEQGEDFVPKLINLFSNGSNKSPEELGKEIGIDISSESFWQKGIDQAS